MVFFRSWNIEDSDLVSCSPLIYCMEPKNQTHEIGAGISYHFSDYKKING